MGNPYTSVSLTGYNSNPPPDDGSAIAANEITWSKHKDKIGDPLKTLAEGVNTNVLAAFGKIFGNSVSSISSNYTVLSTDQGKLLRLTTSDTITLPSAATVGSNFVVAIDNSGGGTIDGNGSETIDGSANATYRMAIYVSDGTNFRTIARVGTLGLQNSDNVSMTGGTIDGFAINGISAFLLPTGSILPYAGSSAPTGFLLCYGQEISRTTYGDLFTAIGTTYGVGDGSSTFALPDLRGRVIAGKDDMGGSSANRLTDQSGGVDGDVLGDTGGSETHTLITSEMPAHTHQMTNSSGGSVNGSNPGTFNTPGGTFNTGSTGGDGAHNNVQPTIILNYIIKT